MLCEIAVQPTDYGRHADQRRHSDNYAEQCEKRSQLVRPERFTGDFRWFTELDSALPHNSSCYLELRTADAHSFLSRRASGFFTSLCTFSRTAASSFIIAFCRRGCLLDPVAVLPSGSAEQAQQSLSSALGFTPAPPRLRGHGKGQTARSKCSFLRVVQQSHLRRSTAQPRSPRRTRQLSLFQLLRNAVYSFSGQARHFSGRRICSSERSS